MISKTDFISFLDAPMHLWAKIHDALESQTPSPRQAYFIQQGQEVEALARQFLTETLLPRVSGGRLFWQAEYRNDHYFVRADALIWDPAEDVFDLYEIKSSTKVKKEHLWDVTFQTLLLETRLNLRDKFILHIHSDYVHNGVMDLSGLFQVDKINDAVEQWRQDVDQWRGEALAVAQSAEPAPDMACTDPDTCPCLAFCHPDLPAHHIYSMPRIGKKAVRLRQAGVVDLADIPEDFPLTPTQQAYLDLVRSGRPDMDARAIRETLATLKFPLYFLDYETCNPALPMVKGYRPYERMVFQYSLHSLNAPDGEPQHVDGLVLDKGDPAPRLVAHLLNHLGAQGSVVVWHQSTEKNLNTALARRCPEFAERLLDINARIFDLKTIFSKGYYRHPDFHGSASLKAVLPVMCPECRYEDLAISEGLIASFTWVALQRGEIPAEDRQRTIADLRAYCKLDTYGMVAIYQKLNQLLREGA